MYQKQKHGNGSGKFLQSQSLHRATLAPKPQISPAFWASARPPATHLYLVPVIFVPCPTEIHANTSSLNFYGPDALPDAQPTVSAQGCIPEVAQSSFAEAKVGLSRLPGTNR